MDNAAYTDEVWMAINGYEGIYEISNHGRVKALDRLVKGKKGLRFQKGSILTCSRGKMDIYVL